MCKKIEASEEVQTLLSSEEITVTDLMNPCNDMEEPEFLLYASSKEGRVYGALSSDLELTVNNLLERIVMINEAIPQEEARDFIMDNGIKLCFFEIASNITVLADYTHYH